MPHSVTLRKLPPHRIGQAKKDEEGSSQIPQKLTKANSFKCFLHVFNPIPKNQYLFTPELTKFDLKKSTYINNSVLVYTISLYSEIVASTRLKLINPFLVMFNHVLSCCVHVHFSYAVVIPYAFLIHASFPKCLQHLRAENDETVSKMQGL